MALLLVMPLINIYSGVSAAANSNISLQIAQKDGTFKSVSSFTSAAEALNAMNSNSSPDAVITGEGSTVLAMKRGMAVSAGYLAAKSTLDFIDAYEGRTAYTSNKNAMFFNSSVIVQNQFAASVTVSGSTNRAYVKYLRLIPYVFFNDGGAYSGKFFLDYYGENSSGELVHTISTFSEGDSACQFDKDEKCVSYSIAVDKAPPFMTQGNKYYSTDGKDFFYNSKLDKKAGTYYIYYKYLSYRSKTNYSASELNKFIKYASEKSGDAAVQSIMLDKASCFLTAQNQYGINAALEIAFANHESAFGKSKISTTKNNLFGINAIDSDPGQADAFGTVNDCINYHAKNKLSREYFNAGGYIPAGIDLSYYSGELSHGDSRYYGASAGNKAFGINVAYASDPYHGEIIAAHMYRLDKYLGFKDYRKYKIGVTNQVTEAYSRPDISSQKLYKLSNPKSGTGPAGIPVIIIGEEGEFYKIQSDMPVRFDISGYTSGLSYYNWDYNFLTAFAYVLKKDIIPVHYLPPDVPMGLKSTGKTISSISIAWEPVNGATGYNIYNGTAKLNELPLKTTVYTASGLSQNTTYSFTVKAVNELGESAASEALAVTTLASPPAPALVKAISTSYNSINIIWSAVAGATGYVIYHLNTKTKAYERIKVTKATKCMITGLQTMEEHTYKVRAYSSVNGINIYGIPSAAFKGKAIPATPGSLTTVRKSDTSIKISWSPVSGATGYVLYRFDSQANTFLRLKVTSALYYTNSGLTHEKTYFYKVRAYRTVNGVNIYGNVSATVFETT